MANTNGFEIITGTSNIPLATAVCQLLNKRLDEPITVFVDGERRAVIKHDLRRKHVFVFQSPSPPNVNDQIIEIMVMVDAAKRASAQEITVLTPYYPYARQDRKEKPRVPISAAALAKSIVCWGANRIVTLDIHSDQLQGVISEPWDNLYASYALVPVLKKQKYKNLVVVAPDMGAAKRARKYAQMIGVDDIAFIYKERDVGSGASEALEIIGHVNNRDVLIVDDIIAGGGTMVNAAKILKESGAKKIDIAVTHGLFLGDAITKIENSAINKIFVTDTINHREEVRKDNKIKIVSVASLLAETIERIHSGESLGEDLFLD